MNQAETITKNPKVREAQKLIDNFCYWGEKAQQGEAYLDFACHAAFPLALTPDLLYRLRDYPFSPSLVVSWMAVSDLLLSPLCVEIGKELYQMNSTVRQVLLVRLRERFGKDRMAELSQFLLKSVKRQFNPRIQGLKQAQYWTALAYVKPGKTATELTETLGKLLQQPKFSEWMQKAALVETLAEPLQAEGYQPLLTLAAAMKDAARGEMQDAEAKFAQLRQSGNIAEIAGIEINLPPPLVDVKQFKFETVTVNRKGEIIKREQHSARYFGEDLGEGVELEMVYIPGGRFMMGSPEGEGDDGEKPQHEVTIPPLFMGKYPITQAQWRRVAKLPQVARELEMDPAEFKGDNRPVEGVSWLDAEEFCQRLSRYSGKAYRLPSEAEWEYSCRAGTTTAFYVGETLTSELANYDGDYTYAEEPKGQYRKETTPVGSFPPNAFGLYDMHGNVWEWCLDDWHDNYEGAPEDGRAWIDDNDNRSQSRKLLRGGSWFDIPELCRSAIRNRDDAGYSSNLLGFRVVCAAAWTL